MSNELEAQIRQDMLRRMIEIRITDERGKNYGKKYLCV